MTDKPIDSPINNPILIDPRMLNSYYDHDDEISLVDLWLSLVKQKKVFFITFLVIILAGLTFSLKQPMLYDYTTTIEIGTKADKETLIQPVETVKSEITSAYINQALHDYYNDNDNDNDIIKLNVENPKGTNLLVIKSNGLIEHDKIHLTIHGSILEKITSKHNATTQSIKEELSTAKMILLNDIEDLENKNLFANKILAAKYKLDNKRQALDKLKENQGNLENNQLRLTSLRELLQNQYKTDTDNLKIVLENQRNASKNITDTALLVLLTSELQQYRTHIAALDERLNITLPAQAEQLKQQISDNLRAQENQQVAIQQAEYALMKLHIVKDRELTSLKNQASKLDHDINALAITHAIVPPSRSFEPAKNKKLLIIAVSVVLGLFMGLFAALFAGFIAKVKEQVNS